jgi:hypothetical protein
MVLILNYQTLMIHLVGGLISYLCFANARSLVCSSLGTIFQMIEKDNIT